MVKEKYLAFIVVLIVSIVILFGHKNDFPFAAGVTLGILFTNTIFILKVAIEKEKIDE